MILYVLWDITSFAMLGLIVMVGFGMAFLVLFSDNFVEDDGGMFSSLPQSLESLYYALLGEFDPDVLRSPPDGLLSLWRLGLFNVFLFLGSVVLLSLLISILGDTYDRVKLKQEAELIKCRARLIRTCAWVHIFVLKILSIFQPSTKSVNYKLKYLMSALLGLHIIVFALSLLNGWLFVSLIGVLTSSFCISFGIRLLVIEHIGKYFVYLVQAEKTVEETGPEWQGKLHALEKMIKTSMEKREEESNRDAHGLKTEIMDLQARAMETAKQIADLKSQMNSIEAQSTRIENALVQLTQTTQKCSCGMGS